MAPSSLLRSLLCAVLVLSTIPGPALAAGVTLAAPVETQAVQPLAAAAAVVPALNTAAPALSGPALALPGALPAAAVSAAVAPAAPLAAAPLRAAAPALAAAPAPAAAPAAAPFAAQPQARAASVSADGSVFDGSRRSALAAADAPLGGAGAGAPALSRGGSSPDAPKAELPSPRSSAKAPSRAGWLGRAASALTRATTALLIGATLLLSACEKPDYEPGPYDPDQTGVPADVHPITYEQMYADMDNTPASASVPPNDYIHTVRNHHNDVVYRTHVNADGKLTAVIEGLEDAKFDLILMDSNYDIVARDNNYYDPYFYENIVVADVEPGDYWLIIHNNNDGALGEPQYFQFDVQPD